MSNFDFDFDLAMDELNRLARLAKKRKSKRIRVPVWLAEEFDEASDIWI